MKAKRYSLARLFYLACFVKARPSHKRRQTKLPGLPINVGFASSAALTTTAKSAAGQALVGSMPQGNTRIASGFLANPLFRDQTVGVSEREDDLAVPAT